MRRSSISPHAFLAALPEERRAEMIELDARIAEVMDGHERVLWEGTFWGGSAQRIIGYGSHRYVSRSGAEVDWFIVGLALQKRHLSLYVSAAEDGTYLVRRYADQLGKVRVGSANVTFARLANVQLPVLLEMVASARDLSTVAASGSSEASEG